MSHPKLKFICKYWGHMSKPDYCLHLSFVTNSLLGNLKGNNRDVTRRLSPLSFAIFSKSYISTIYCLLYGA